MKLQLVFGVFLLCLAVDARAQSAQSLDQLNNTDLLTKALGEVQKMKAQLTERARDNKYACLKAFGNEAFCGCLAQKLPIAFSFADYIAIVTLTREENGYASLDADFKKAYDAVPRVRDTCVAQAWRAP